MVDELNLDLLPAVESVGTRAVAYFRSSLDDEGRSVEVQRDFVRRWAAANGVRILREFCDSGPGTVEDRSGLVEMMEEWVARRDDFEAVICFDRTRLGRWVDGGCAELAAVCEENGKTMLLID
ncbi:DNA invertase Pin-like site-specific DNA recombinase [Rhodopirellula rubra]|uniref:DNA invertase Pin-like site-specific DNA recombinase n=1 Tax=Aporhodopirellula rubra TaxID=980271 RepID=A0A7W5DW37_9BACT|nr:recombinase family protein [Aporhodopirellula rubra]MBB3205490.1 DNA invertase Pin-like site-specific DNA recombinase [Aporhodopirellula rubra]